MATATRPHENLQSDEPQVFRLGGLDWAAYRMISEALTGRHVRITYDRGTLELMTISTQHGRLSRLIARLIAILTEELNITICTCGDMTCDREDLDRALEPDEGFYLQNEPLIRHKEQIDLSVDPPPDLAVEVELSRARKNRMAIYAALGIPEVWRFAGDCLRFYQRQADGTYVEIERSTNFPLVSGEDVAVFLRQRAQVDENTLAGSFRAWVKERIAAQA